MYWIGALIGLFFLVVLVTFPLRRNQQGARRWAIATIVLSVLALGLLFSWTLFFRR